MKNDRSLNKKKIAYVLDSGKEEKLSPFTKNHRAVSVFKWKWICLSMTVYVFKLTPWREILTFLSRLIFELS